MKARIREMKDAEGRRVYTIDVYREDVQMWYEDPNPCQTWRTKKAAGIAAIEYGYDLVENFRM